jgi:DNA topoisomerase-1
VLHEGTFANLDGYEEIFTVGLNRAVDLLARRAAGRGAAGKPAALRDLGAHPAGGGPIQVMSGRYGPYVKFGKINATLPKGTSPETITVDEAVALIAAKDGKPSGGKKAARPKRAAKPK